MLLRRLSWHIRTTIDLENSCACYPECQLWSCKFNGFPLASGENPQHCPGQNLNCLSVCLRLDCRPPVTGPRFPCCGRRRWAECPADSRHTLHSVDLLLLQLPLGSQLVATTTQAPVCCRHESQSCSGTDEGALIVAPHSLHLSSLHYKSNVLPRLDQLSIFFSLTESHKTTQEEFFLEPCHSLLQNQIYVGHIFNYYLSAVKKLSRFEWNSVKTKHG